MLLHIRGYVPNIRGYVPNNVDVHSYAHHVIMFKRLLHNCLNMFACEL